MYSDTYHYTIAVFCVSSCLRPFAPLLLLPLKLEAAAGGASPPLIVLLNTVTLFLKVKQIFERFMTAYP